MSTVQLDGDVTFENVWLSLGQTSGRGGRGTVSSFYANGFTAEFTENFEQVITNLYGGGNGTTSSSTHLIINGDIICNANPQNYRVFGGGKNTSNSTTNGKVTGDVLIELGPHCRVPWVYGGGYNSSVGGNVTIILNGDINDPDHQVGNITGGGLGSSTSPTGGSAVIASIGKDSGTVTGNVNVYLYSGRFSAISAGGGQNSTGTRSSAIKNTTSAYYGKSLYGNVLINIEDGSVGQVYMGNPTKANPNGFQNLQKLPKIYGTKGMELHITGGTFTGNPSIYAHEITTGYNGQRIYFENDVPVYLYQISSAASRQNGDQADIIVQNTQPASIRYYVNSRGTQYPALKDCGDIEIIGGTLALPAADEEVPQNAVLNAEGSVSLAGTAQAGCIRWNR